MTMRLSPMRLSPTTIAYGSIAAGALVGGAATTMVGDHDRRMDAIRFLLLGSIGSYYVVKAVIKHDLPIPKWFVLADESVRGATVRRVSPAARMALGVSMFALGGAFLGASIVSRTTLPPAAAAGG